MLKIKTAIFAAKNIESEEKAVKRTKKVVVSGQHKRLVSVYPILAPTTDTKRHRINRKLPDARMRVLFKPKFYSYGYRKWRKQNKVKTHQIGITARQNHEYNENANLKYFTVYEKQLLYSQF